MRVCFITSEVFIRRHGGFRKLVRITGMEDGRKRACWKVIKISFN